MNIADFFNLVKLFNKYDMYSHRSFLQLSSGGSMDLMSLIKEGHEIFYCDFSLQQGIDAKGEATTQVWWRH